MVQSSTNVYTFVRFLKLCILEVHYSNLSRAMAMPTDILRFIWAYSRQAMAAIFKIITSVQLQRCVIYQVYIELLHVRNLLVSFCMCICYYRVGLSKLTDFLETGH
jgi:hypothetical protein